MDCSEDLGADDMITVQQVAPSSILVPVSSETVGGGRVCGAAGGAELGRRLLLAARHGDTPAVLDLMARGAPFTTDWLGTSALHLAAGGAHAQTCAVLLRAGVSRDCRTKVDRTPLHLAAHAGHTNVVTLLLDNNAAVDCRDMLQMTPLHWASARGHAAAARALLGRGADPRARSKFNKTPLQLARSAGHAALADLLEAHEAAALVTTTHETETPTTRQTTQDPPKFTETKATKQTSQPEPIKISIERNEEGAGAEAAAAMLRRHGITLLPRDEGSTVLSALQSGRSVVLSDAGKLMLKESSVAPPAPAPAAPPAPAPAPKVVLSAKPVPPPPPGAAVKIFTLNNKIVTLPKENKAPVKKVIDPFDSSQVQYIKLPSDAKITMLKSKSSPARAAPAPSPALKLTLQKSDNALQTGAGAGSSVLYVPEQFMSNSSPKYLRTQLLAAHRTIARLTAQLASANERLAQMQKD